MAASVYLQHTAHLQQTVALVRHRQVCCQSCHSPRCQHRRCQRCRTVTTHQCCRCVRCSWSSDVCWKNTRTSFVMNMTRSWVRSWQVCDELVLQITLIVSITRLPFSRRQATCECVYCLTLTPSPWPKCSEVPAYKKWSFSLWKVRARTWQRQIWINALPIYHATFMGDNHINFDYFWENV